MHGSMYCRHAAASSSDDGGMSRSEKSKPNEVMPHAAELNVDVRRLGQLGDVFLPAGEDLLPPPAIRADAEHAADVVQDDRRIGKVTGEVDRVLQLRMVLPQFDS